MSPFTSRITIRSYAMQSLADPIVRRNVLAAANALGERMGVPVVEVVADDDALHICIQGPSVVAAGFAAELRRTTERWHVARYGAPLWHSGT